MSDIIKGAQNYISKLSNTEIIFITGLRAISSHAWNVSSIFNSSVPAARSGRRGPLWKMSWGIRSACYETSTETTNEITMALINAKFVNAIGLIGQWAAMSEQKWNELNLQMEVGRNPKCIYPQASVQVWIVIFQHPVAFEVTHVCFLPSLMQLCFSWFLWPFPHPVHRIGQCFPNVTNYTRIFTKIYPLYGICRQFAKMLVLH
jgi:hypothetical protein